jgi:hypothetical protein
MRRFEVSAIKFDRNSIVDATKEGIFVAADRNHLEFG